VVLLLLLLFIAKNKSKSKQARKHTIVLCEIGKVLLFVVAHSLQKPNPNPRSKASMKTNNVVL
jgi:hypothetical protein